MFGSVTAEWIAAALKTAARRHADMARPRMGLAAHPARRRLLGMIGD